MKATQEQRGRDNFMTPGCKGLYDANQSNGGSSAWGCRPETWSRDATRPRPVRPRSQGKGWEKGLSPELCGPGFQGGSGRPCRIQLWSPAADPLLTCTKSTKSMDNCQPGFNSRPNRREQDELRGVGGQQSPDLEQQHPRKQRRG